MNNLFHRVFIEKFKKFKFILVNNLENVLSEQSYKKWWILEMIFAGCLKVELAEKGKEEEKE